MPSTSSVILGIDYGRRRCGLAVSDPDHILATPLPTCERGRKDARQMPRILRERLVEFYETVQFGSIVFGWPDAENETSRELQAEIRRVSASLQELWPIELAFWNEAYTSMEAVRRLQSAPRRIRREKGRIDQLAAQILLQEFLDAGCPFASAGLPPIQNFDDFDDRGGNGP